MLGRGATAVVFANEGSSGPCQGYRLPCGSPVAVCAPSSSSTAKGHPKADVAAAARWANRAGARRVALVGAGRGARAVVITAIRRPEFVAAVVSLSAEQLQNGRDDLAPDVRRLRSPVLWVGSRDDNLTNWGTDTRTLSRATRARHELILVHEGYGVELLDGAPGERVVPALERFVLGR